MNTGLNNKIWDNTTNINPDVRKRLLQVSKDFISFSKIKNLKIHDILFVGSLASYNWHDQSDIDIHIIFDLNKFKINEEFIKEYLKSKATIWNFDKIVNIYGFKIEIYPDDTKTTYENRFNGIFSLVKNEWLRPPTYLEQNKQNVNRKEVRELYEKYVSYINYFEKQVSTSNIYNYSNLITSINDFKDSIRNKRNDSLKKFGEYSTDNLVFKMLRNTNQLQKLNEIKKKIYTKSLSLESIKYDNGDKFILKDNIETLHSKKDDVIKVMNNKLSENVVIKNMRNRRKYNVKKTEFNVILLKKLIEEK